jgi:ubiquinone/menaquinone biosynthesis C-methylase UbiE
MEKDYRLMWDDFAQKKSTKYLKEKFDPGDVVGFKNLLREKTLLALLDPKINEYLLDIGCASGRQCFILADKCRKVIGTDISKIFVEKAWEHSNRIKSNNVFLLVSDIENIPFPSNYFDKVLCSEVFEHILRPKKAIEEIFRVLKPGGILVISTPNMNGEGTLWKRFKRIITGKKFSPLKEISMKGIETHGDAHLREFSYVKLRNFLKSNNFKTIEIYGSSILDWPFFNLSMKFLIKSSPLRNLFLEIDIFLGKNKFLVPYSSNLVVKARKLTTKTQN